MEGEEINENYGTLSRRKDELPIQKQKIYDEQTIEKFKTTCMNMSLPPKTKFQNIKDFFSYCPHEAQDMVTRYTDCLRYLHDSQRENLSVTLQYLTTWNNLTSMTRIMIAVTLYNQGFIDICYDCFSKFLEDDDIEVEEKVESCKYLYVSDKPEYRIRLKEYLISVINNNCLTSEYRYGIVMSFSSKYGVKSLFNARKLYIEFDENFVFSLQLAFFENEKNDTDKRIMSGEYILQMEVPTKEEKDKVVKMLLSIILNEAENDNIRAIACDVVLRLGSIEESKIAENMIYKLGRKRDGRFANIETLYSNSQNAHDKAFAEAVKLFAERYFSGKDEIRLLDHDAIYRETVAYIKKIHTQPKDRFSAMKALNTLVLDSATFTKYKLTISEVYDKVWSIVDGYDSEKKEEYKRRIAVELLDMCEICPTGLIGRIVNLLSLETGDVKITFEDQIISNIAGRIQARIRNIEDEEMKGSIYCATMNDPSSEDVEIFKSFIEKIESPLKRELYTEFVDSKLVKKKEFNIAFEKGMFDWKKIFVPTSTS
jgi:hypothetical protein